MKIFTIIPARAGSKRIINKNIVPICGKPMINYSIETSLKSSYISRTFVSTDSEEIALISLNAGAEAPFLRPKEISKDGSTDIEYMLHFLKYLKDNKQKLPDYIVQLRPTIPVRDVKVLDNAIKLFTKNAKKRDSLRSVEALNRPIEKMFYVNKYLEPIIKTGNSDFNNYPCQLFKKTYITNGYIDICKTKIIEKGNLYGNKITPFFTKKSIDIDDEEDLELVRIIMSNKIK